MESEFIFIEEGINHNTVKKKKAVTGVAPWGTVQKLYRVHIFYYYLYLTRKSYWD